MCRSIIFAVTALFVLGFSALGLGANPGDVVINEIYPNSPDFYDGSEYIELYNTTASDIDVSGWVLSGTEYDGVCGEHHHEFPAGTVIPAHGYLIIARDVADGDGFEDRFGFLPDLEMYDSSQGHEVDDPRVPNTICQNPDDYDDQIRLIPGTSDYAKSCSGSYNKYEVLFLYDSPSRTNLIDAMEYMDPSYCTSDQCLGVNVSDNDAFPGLPDEAVSLGRDENSTDTDNSSADFSYQAPTPGAANITNVGPEIWRLRYSPCVPEPTDSVTISCYVTDSDGIKWVRCYYNLNGGAFDSTTMYADPGDSLYHCNLPPRAQGSQVAFYVRASDNLDAISIYPTDAPDGAYRYSVGLTAISDIQFVDIGDDSSYYVGQAVNCTGIVTVGRGVYNDYVFVIQNGSGAWNGIFVYDPTESVPVEEGDSVTVSGKVMEYFGRTEIYLFVGCVTVHGNGYDLPAPAVVTTGTLSSTSTLAERYEGVLVRVENVTVTNDSLGFGEWEINDGSGPCIVDDAAYYFYEPEDGDELVAVQGVLDYTYGDYKIEPRRSEDIVGPPVIFNLVYSPHAPTETDVVTVSATVKGYNPITSVKLFYSTTGGAGFDSTAMVSPDSVYTATVGPFSDGTIVDYYVEAWDSAGFVARKPSSGSYAFYVGMKTIYDVQYVPAGQDSSPLAGKPVNVAGIVTAPPGVYSDYFFFIENSYDGGSPQFRGVKVYDRTGTVSVSLGDSVTVSGRVVEYYNETEIYMHFPEAITVHSSSNPVPQPYSVPTASIDTSEAWEGVLVIANGATVADPNAGFGEWLITNGGAADTCRVGDRATYTYQPHLGDNVNVAGIVMYSYKKYRLEPRGDDDICEPGEAGAGDVGKPVRLALSVSPNPVVRSGEILLAIPSGDKVSMRIYDVKGRLVKTLVDGHLQAGNYRFLWDGTNAHNGFVTPGIYFVRVDSRHGSLTAKIVLSR